MLTVKLLGEAGRRYTRKLELDVATPVEAVNALETLFPGFRQYLMESDERGIKWRVICDNPQGIAEADLDKPISQMLVFAPIIEGRGEFGQLIAGTVLAIAGAIFAQPWLLNLGLSLVFSGIASLLSPTPPTRKDAQRNTSYLFANTEYGSAQGIFMPVLYGETMMTTPPVINYGIQVDPPEEYIFRKPDFCATDGFELKGVAAVTSCRVRLAPAAYYTVGGIYWGAPYAWTRNFSTSFNINIYGGSGADGFCLQWFTQKVVGGDGGNVGRVGNAELAFSALTFNPYGDPFTIYRNGAGQSLGSGFEFRANNYFWFDYNHGDGVFKIYWSYSSTKPDNPRWTTNFRFSETSLYIGLTAATGAFTDNHDLMSWEAKWTR